MQNEFDMLEEMSVRGEAGIQPITEPIRQAHWACRPSTRSSSKFHKKPGKPVITVGQICRPKARASPKPLQEHLRSRRPTHQVADGYASTAVPDSFSDTWQPFWHASKGVPTPREQCSVFPADTTARRRQTCLFTKANVTCCLPRVSDVGDNTVFHTAEADQTRQS